MERWIGSIEAGAMATSGALGTNESRCPAPGVAPLVPLALAVMAGIALDRFVVAGTTTTWATMALAASTLGWAFRRWPRLGVVPILIGCAALGGGWHHHRWSDLASDDLARHITEDEGPRPVWVRGVLVDVPALRPPGEGFAFRPDDPGTTRSVLAVTGWNDGQDWHSASGRVQLLIAGDRTDLRAGDPVEVAGTLSVIAGPLNPGEIDRRLTWRARGVRLRLATDTPQGVWPDPQGRIWLGARWRGACRAWSHAKLVEGLEARVAPLAAALLLGRREAIDPEVNDAYARSGTMHLLAISGLHMQALAGLVWLGLWLLGVGRRPAFLVVLVASVGYAVLVGMRPSVVRAAVMTSTVCLGGLLDRPTRPSNLLALAALVTLALNPSFLFEVGAQLSFLAVAAILWGVPGAVGLFTRPLSPLDRLERRLEPRWKSLARRGMEVVLQGLAVSAVVSAVTAPLIAWWFHLVSPIGVLLNLVLVPLTALALATAALTLVLSATAGGLLAKLAASACEAVLGVSESLVRWGAEQPRSHAFIAGPPGWWVVGFYLGLSMVGWLAVTHRPGRRWGLAALGAWTALGLALVVLPTRPPTLEAEVLAVGHGLAVTVRTPDGATLLYDCGRLGDPSIGRRMIAPALWARGARRIDTVILSHADADHYNGLTDLLDRLPIGEVRVPPDFDSPDNPGAVALIEAIEARGIPVRTIRLGDRWETASGVRFDVLHPAEGWLPGTSDNARSVVLDISAGGRHFLLTGDLDGEGLAEVATQPRRTLDAVLAPHHGGRTANPDWFYLWSDPGFVVVSQRPPRPGTRDALADIEARGLPVLRTWERGAIRLLWTETGLDARGWLDERPAPGRPLSFGHRPWFISPWPSAVLDLRSGGARAALAVLAILAGALLGGWRAVADFGAWALVTPRRPLDVLTASPPEPAPWKPLEVRAADGVLLRGAWRPADGGPADRWAVLLHGFAEDRAALVTRAEGLAARGWHVAVLDHRGRGRSDGDRCSFGGREAGDVTAWLDALANQTGAGANPAPVFVVWGRSMGAAVALRAASQDPRIAAVVLEAPYADLRRALASWLACFRLPGGFAGPILRRARRFAGVPLDRPRPIEVAARVTTPTLILAGTDDPITPPAEAQRLARAFPTPAELVEVPGARHGNVFDLGGPDLLDRIATFLDRARKPPPVG